MVMPAWRWRGDEGLDIVDEFYNDESKTEHINKHMN
jgi:hypothetical protein